MTLYLKDYSLRRITQLFVESCIFEHVLAYDFPRITENWTENMLRVGTWKFYEAVNIISCWATTNRYKDSLYDKMVTNDSVYIYISKVLENS